MDGERLRDEVRTAYDTVAEDYAALFSDTTPESAVDLAMIDHALAQLSPDARTVLDAGCGAGRIARYLADRGCQVHGIDLSPNMIAMARRDHPDIATQVASMTDLPFPDAGFDLVVFWYSIIHVADDDLPAAFGEARRVLRPGGLVLVGFQAGDGVRDVGPAYRRLGHDVRLTRFDRTPDHVSRLLARAGVAEEARLVRRPVAEHSDQAILLGRVSGSP